MVDFFTHINARRFWSHLCFWAFWIASFTIIQSLGYGKTIYFSWLIYYLVTLPLFVVHTYLIAYWLIPRYFFNRRFVLFTLWVFILLIVASLAELLLSNELIWTWVNPENIQQGNYLNVSNVLINGVGNEYIIVVFLSVKVVKYWNSKKGEQAELMNRKLQTEIELLHLQACPRFVLNVIERLDQLARNNSTLTSEMIVRISNLMNHMPTNLKTEKIALVGEVEMIRNYIEIQRLNFPKGFNASLLMDGDLRHHRIPPFLLFQMVDEGFAILDNHLQQADFLVMIKSELTYLHFSMNVWDSNTLKKPFDPLIVENVQKYLDYFYPDNHRFISNFELNFVELTLEIFCNPCH